MKSKKPTNERLKEIIKGNTYKLYLYIGGFIFGVGIFMIRFKILTGLQLSLFALFLIILGLTASQCRWNAGIVLEIRELKEMIKNG